MHEPPTPTPAPISPIPRWLRVLVHLDFVAAVLLTVIAPLLLLVRAATRYTEQLPVLLAYWRSSSLLMVTVYLLIGGRGVAFLAGIGARLLIPWTLRAPVATPDPWFAGWQRVVRGYCLLGALLNVPMLRCLRQDTPDTICRAYAEPPRKFAAVLHPGVSSERLGTAGEIGLAAFVAGAVLLWRFGKPPR